MIDQGNVQSLVEPSDTSLQLGLIGRPACTG